MDHQIYGSVTYGSASPWISLVHESSGHVSVMSKDQRIHGSVMTKGQQIHGSFVSKDQQVFGSDIYHKDHKSTDQQVQGSSSP